LKDYEEKCFAEEDNFTKVKNELDTLKKLEAKNKEKVGKF
jgi:hypothetical protein